MRALFAKGMAQSSVLRKLDARTKLIVTATTAVLTVASSGMVSQLVLFAVMGNERNALLHRDCQGNKCLVHLFLSFSIKSSVSNLRLRF